MTLLLDIPATESHPQKPWKVESGMDAGDSGAWHRPPADAPQRSDASTPKKGPRLPRQSPESAKLLALLKRMARGDADAHPALAGCYDLMGGVVFSLAVRMLRDRPAAEDVTQDIFVQIWRQADRFDASRGSPEAWVMMIARTRILDRLRSRAAGIVLKPAGDNLPDAPEAEDWPDDLAVTREQAAAVRSALIELPADQRKAVELAFFDGMTHQEISEALTVPLGTVKTRIRLGLLKIKEMLRGVEGDADEMDREASSKEQV